MEEFHLQTRTKEHHHFLVSVLSKESKQQQESLLWRTHDITLKHQPNKHSFNILHMPPLCNVHQDMRLCDVNEQPLQFHYIDNSEW